MRILAYSLAVLLTASAAANVCSAATLEDDDWGCSTPLTISTDEAKTLKSEAHILIYHVAKTRFALIEFPDHSGPNEKDLAWSKGVAVAVEERGHWKLYGAARLSGVQNVSVAKGGNDVFIFTMPTSEGPGAQFDVLYTHDGFSSLHCSSIGFPPALNEPTFSNGYLDFLQFNGKLHGAIKVVGKSENKPQGSKAKNFYVYSSVNNGNTWNETSLNKRPQNLTGSYYTKSGNKSVILENIIFGPSN